jgi:type VI secretion system protein ImpH
MGADDRLPAAALIARLRANPQRFDLFQAISLLERSVPWARPLGRGDGLNEAVRLTGHVSLAFQPSDIHSVRENPAADQDDGPGVSYGQRPAWTLATSVLTLAGANGPLPRAYTELVLERRAQRDSATADLLDIFNHRFLSFLYRSRKKHAPGLNGRSPHASAIATSLDALSNLGLRTDERGPQDARLWLRHAGLLSAAPRSMTGLTAMLADRLGLEVRGAQFVGGWREINRADSLRLAGMPSKAEPKAEPNADSGTTRLTGVAVLGRRTWDQASGICLEFPALSKARFEALLPGGADHARAAWLIRTYLQQDFDVQFVLHPGPDFAPQAACAAGGAQAAKLGWTTWLGGSRHTTHAPAPVRLAMREAAVPAPKHH